MKLWKFAQCSLLAIAFACTAPVVAQNGFQPSGPTALDARGFASVSVRNVSRIDITAIRVSHLCVGDHGEMPLSIENFDIAFDTPVQPIPPLQAIRPDAEKRFMFSGNKAACPIRYAVVFADGHGEGEADGPYGWSEIVVERQAALKVFQDAQALIQKLPSDPEAFRKAFSDELKDRLARVPDYPGHTAAPSGSKTQGGRITWMLNVLQMPDGTLNTRQDALRTLDRWMKPLRTALQNNSSPL